MSSTTLARWQTKNNNKNQWQLTNVKMKRIEWKRLRSERKKKSVEKKVERNSTKDRITTNFLCSRQTLYIQFRADSLAKPLTLLFSLARRSPRSARPFRHRTQYIGVAVDTKRSGRCMRIVLSRRLRSNDQHRRSSHINVVVSRLASRRLDESSSMLSTLSPRVPPSFSFIPFSHLIHRKYVVYHFWTPTYIHTLNAFTSASNRRRRPPRPAHTHTPTRCV